MQYVEGELKKNPRVKNVSLFAFVREIDESVGELTLQQFHAKYQLVPAREVGIFERIWMTGPFWNPA